MEKNNYIKYLTAAANAALKTAINYTLPNTKLHFDVDQKYVCFKINYIIFR